MKNGMGSRINDLRNLKQSILTGDAKKVSKHHAEGKFTARERVDKLLDAGSFVEFNMLAGHTLGTPADGLVAGHGMIEGRQVCVYAQDSMVIGGSVGALGGYKMYSAIETAVKMGVPIVGMHDSPGARLRKLESSLRIDQPGGIDMVKYPEEKSAGSVFFPLTQGSGIIPQICTIMGTCAGMGVYSSQLYDFVFMIDGMSKMFVTGPRVAKSLTGESITAEELGGSKMHAQISGQVDFRVAAEEECFIKIRQLLSFLPNNNKERPPYKAPIDDPSRVDDCIADTISADPDKPYDMHRLIERIVDSGNFFETKAEFAQELITGFARLDGYPVGIIANQPAVNSGMLTVNTANKESRFIRFCDAFGIPLVMLVDTPAYLPGREQEQSGTIRSTAKVLYALCEAVVPRVAVVIRRSYGGAGNLSMGVNPGLGTDFVFAWPTAETSQMRAEQLVELFYGAEIAEAENPQQMRDERIKEYRNWYANIISQASMRTHITDVIEPSETRLRLITSLKLLRDKTVIRYFKRHGNIPL